MDLGLLTITTVGPFIANVSRILFEATVGEVARPAIEQTAPIIRDSLTTFTGYCAQSLGLDSVSQFIEAVIQHPDDVDKQKALEQAIGRLDRSTQQDLLNLLKDLLNQLKPLLELIKQQQGDVATKPDIRLTTVPDYGTGQIPREGLQEQIKQMLNERHVAFLSGFSGSGKTLLACLHAKQQSQAYSHRLFLHAGDETAWTASLSEVCQFLALSLQPNEDPGKNLHGWLCRQDPEKPVLIIADNADTEAMLETVLHWFDRASGGRLLITTQMRRTENGGIPVTEFTSEEARQFLNERTGLTENATPLLAATGCLPLCTASKI